MKQLLDYTRLLFTEYRLRLRIKNFGKRLNLAKHSIETLDPAYREMGFRQISEIEQEGAWIVPQLVAISSEIEFCKLEIMQCLGRMSAKKLTARLSLFDALKQRTTVSLALLKSMRSEIQSLRV